MHNTETIYWIKINFNNAVPTSHSGTYDNLQLPNTNIKIKIFSNNTSINNFRFGLAAAQVRQKPHFYSTRKTAGQLFSVIYK